MKLAWGVYRQRGFAGAVKRLLRIAENTNGENGNMIAVQLFQQILSLFIIIGLGFLFVKLGFLKSGDSRVLSVVCIYLVIPCVILNAFQIDYTPEIMEGFLTAVVLSVLLHILLFIIGYLLKKLFHMTDVERLSVIYSNCGNLVVPLVIALFGEEWVIYSSAYICVQTFFVWTHGYSVMSGQTAFNWKKIFLNVNVICCVIGTIMFLLHIKLPEILGNAVHSMAGIIGPLSMIIIGMLMAGTDMKRMFQRKRIYLVTFLRLIGAPLAGIVMLRAAGNLMNIENQQTILTIVLLSYITPAAATITQLSQYFDNDVEYCSAINVLTTMLCIITMPLMLAVFLL